MPKVSEELDCFSLKSYQPSPIWPSQDLGIEMESEIGIDILGFSLVSDNPQSDL
jgi:hypothetical protein